MHSSRNIRELQVPLTNPGQLKLGFREYSLVEVGDLYLELRRCVVSDIRWDFHFPSKAIPCLWKVPLGNRVWCQREGLYFCERICATLWLRGVTSSMYLSTRIRWQAWVLTLLSFTLPSSVWLYVRKTFMATWTIFEFFLPKSWCSLQHTLMLVAFLSQTPCQTSP